jgi:glycosyltransferase involved in cell wall biosynthesis
MKILVVSNVYPPHFVGGYELGCRDVVEGLKARGHSVCVVTSDFRNATEIVPDTPEINRELRFQASGGLRTHYTESRKFNSILQEFRPDLVYQWSLSYLCPWLPMVARCHGIPVVFFLFDTTFTSWRVGAWLASLARKSPALESIFRGTFLVEGWSVLQNMPCHFGSDFLRQTAISQGIKFEEKRSSVIKWGIVPTEFTSPEPLRNRWPVKRLLYVGQISRIKGIHTAIAAVGELAKKGWRDLFLTIVGGGYYPDYEKELRSSAQKLGIADRVNFHGKVPRSALAHLYAENDIFLFPSEWAEPFGITRLEAMVAGLVVVGTTTGGSGELLRDRETGLVFNAGDPVDCARAIEVACSDQKLFESLQEKGRREVLTNHSFDRMMDSIEASLLSFVKS